MDEIKDYFSAEEIEEINIFRDGTNGMSVEREEIVCFRFLSDIISQKTNINNMSRNDLVTSYAQLKGLIGTFESFGFVDVSLLNGIVSKAKKLFADELEKRRSS